MAATNDDKNADVAISGDRAEFSDVKVDGELEFVQEYGGNLSKPSYQEASGAPVESISPLGLQVGPVTAVFLNIGQMIETGVFSTPATILKGTGSVGLSLIFWTIGFLIASAQLGIYVELATYPRPKYLLPTAFAVQSVILSFSSSNAIVMAQYLYAIGGYTPSAWELKGLAVASMTFVFLLVIFSTRLSLRLSNTVGVIKIITLIFISITGFVVLGGHTRVKNQHANFTNSFAGTGSSSGYGLSNALVKVNFAYAGYLNAFNVVNEIKNPIKTLKRTAPASLLIVAILYLLCNVAYFAAVPKAALESSSQLAASLFFSAVFGSERAPRALNFLIALSAFGNITSVVIGSSRVIRECGRQGVLPFPRAWASTRPFGTPIAAYTLKWGLTLLMILAPPAGDAFNFIVDLQSYPSNVFLFAMTFGLVLIRHRRKKLGIQGTEFRVWDVAIVFSLAVNVFLLIMPWYPPPSGRNGGDVSFWYATYCATGLGILALCWFYHFVWTKALPYFGHYRIRQELIVLDDETAKLHRLVKVPLAELEVWDKEHDAQGQKLVPSRASWDKADKENESSKDEKIGQL